MQEDELEDVVRPFQAPFGPPFAPPGPPPGGFLRSGPPPGRFGPPGPPRESDDLLLRKVPRETAQRFRAAAGGRGMTYAQYLAALVALHDAARGLADGGDARIAAELERLGLQTVSV